ncbi:ABC transporter substrate-binding protein [Leptolyngbya sp. 7M]|uniref:ABC transporter substrate-binding protein n=1 Tax=Leptolyngbya sp. 7M TaxID=2812896 RepID=UPI001B8D2771|nr:ABC transporter substrate-binding protein [Leptolyngbya sp. 7M]QYO63395.1 hypothetical protein JVX88_26315 [Leptolyngbya sp. 7M]
MIQKAERREMAAGMLKLKWNVGLRQAMTLLLALVLILPLVACNPSQFRTQAAQVPRLVRTSISEPKTFNYVTSDDTNSTEIVALVYDGLLSTNGVTGELEPGLAESWEISPDQTRIVYKLRPGLKWSDGAPITVDDIVFTYNDIIFNEKIPTSTADIFRIGDEGAFPTVRKLDEQRVEFAAPEPFAPLLRFAGGAFLPKHALEKTVTTLDSEGNPQFLSTWGTDSDPKQIIGSGPYRIKSYQPSERVILERNPHYWRKDALGNQQPYIDQFIIQIVASTDVSLMQFRAGGVDVEGVTR